MQNPTISSSIPLQIDIDGCNVYNRDVEDQEV